MKIIIENEMFSQLIMDTTLLVKVGLLCRMLSLCKPQGFYVQTINVFLKSFQKFRIENELFS